MSITAKPFDQRYTPVSESGCWLWDDARDTQGYGRLKWRGRIDGAHRVAWTQAFGEIPDGAQVLHRCNVKCCVNPAHLYLGDHRQNALDAIRDGLWKCPDRKGARNGRARLTAADAETIKRRYQAGGISQQALANEYGVIQAHVSRIVRGAAWGAH